MEAEAEAEAVALKGDAEAYAIEIKAKAEVGFLKATWIMVVVQIDEMKKILEEVSSDQAEKMAKKADAWKEYKEAAMVDMMLQTLPKAKGQFSS